VNNTGADEASVSEALARAQQARSECENERTKSSAARTDEAVAGAAVVGANQQDREDRNEPASDPAERRQQLAQSMEGKGDRKSVNSRLLADKHQGTHPSAAVAQKLSLAKTPKLIKQRVRAGRWTAEESNAEWHSHLTTLAIKDNKGGEAFAAADTKVTVTKYDFIRFFKPVARHPA
jgi:hypothetical protein